MAKPEESDVIRWRRQTPKSQAYGWGANILTLTGVWAMLAEFGGSWPGYVLVLGGIGLSFLVARRYTTVILRPRPQRAVDKREFNQLAGMQLILTVICWAALTWFGINVGSRPLTAPVIATAAAAFVTLTVANVFFKRAYDRLFDRIASKDGAYGF